MSIGLAAVLASGSVLAGTPVTEGYRDHAYGGGAFRPSSDKPQSKTWFADGSWWAGMFRYSVSPSIADYRIFKLTADKTGWTATTTVVDGRDTSHADYLWDQGASTLYVASVPPVKRRRLRSRCRPPRTTSGSSSTRMRLGRTRQVGGIKSIAGTASTASPAFRGGAYSVTIEKDSSDRLWLVWAKGTAVMYSYSDDDGVNWTAPAQLPAQTGNPINSDGLVDSDIASVISFGTKIGVAWSDQDDSGATLGADNGFYFAVADAGVADPTLAGSWSLEELPTLNQVGNTQIADNHINLKKTSDGRVYMVGKTGRDTVACATGKQHPLVEFFQRTAGGAWSAHLAGTVGDCNTRPQIAISEQLEVAYLFMTSPNGGGTVYTKSAPLTGPEAFKFRGVADQTIQRGTPFIKSATETLIDDPSTTKQTVTSTSGIAVIANNLTSSAGGNAKVYLHNVMDIPASDGTAPTGTVSINGGAATTSSQAATVAVPATDAGSGLSLVKLSNNSDMSSSSTFVYTTPIAWTLTAGDGVKTVYVQWRDAAGNWSSVANDTITVDTSDPIAPSTPGVPAHTLFGSGRFGVPVRITWAASTDNIGVASYHLQRSIDGGAYRDGRHPLTNGYSIDLSNSAHNYRFRVRAFDGVNYSAFRTGPTFRTISYSESSTAVKYSGTWGLSTSPVYVGGKARVGSVAGRSATLAFNGNRVAWLSRTGPTYGSARVYIDGSLVKTVNLNAATVTDRKMVFVRSWAAVGNHTIRIVVVGTSGHPGVVLDQIFVLR